MVETTKSTSSSGSSGSSSSDSGTSSKAKLGPASESGDPAVHQILAEMDIARQNGDKKAVDAATAKLSELGYE